MTLSNITEAILGDHLLDAHGACKCGWNSKTVPHETHVARELLRLKYSPPAERKAVSAARTVSLAKRLAANLDTIARHENAAQCYTDIQNAVDKIELMINRPIPPRYCGPCPTPVDHRDITPPNPGECLDIACEMSSNTTRCGTALVAPREATQVRCHTCKTLHQIEDIEKQLWSEVNEWLLSPSEILMVMDYFGQPVAESTFRRWRATGKLQPRGQRNGKPRYWPGDVRALRKGTKP